MHLVLLCSHFPYGTGETFLEAEVDYLIRQADRITILAEDHRDGEATRPLPDRCTARRYATDSSWQERLVIPWLILRHIRLFIRMIRQEIRVLRTVCHQTLTLAILRKMFHDWVKGMQIARMLMRDFTPEHTIFYAYWLKNTALGIAMAHQLCDAYHGISRAHGHDLYVEVHRPAYLSFQLFKATHLDRIYFISEQGRSYFIRQTGISSDRTAVARLGTPDPIQEAVGQDESGEQESAPNVPLIVTCSNLPSSDVKRIPLLIQALSYIDFPLRWTHIGSGPMEGVCREMARSLQADHPHITCTFTGTVQNSEVHRFYRTHRVSAVVNVSRSEGLPVSLMEAISYGIPILATDVGGTSEVCNVRTGRLLPPDLTPEALAEALREFVLEQAPHMDRDGIRHYWKEHFSARQNHTAFAREIASHCT